MSFPDRHARRDAGSPGRPGGRSSGCLHTCGRSCPSGLGARFSLVSRTVARITLGCRSCSDAPGRHECGTRGEFAWSSLEPRQDVYRFGWLHRAIAEIVRHGVSGVLGTPTAAPPAWLTQSYPDTLCVDQDRHRAQHWNHQQFSLASTRYRALVRDIVRRLPLPPSMHNVFTGSNAGMSIILPAHGVDVLVGASP